MNTAKKLELVPESSNILSTYTFDIANNGMVKSVCPELSLFLKIENTKEAQKNIKEYNRIPTSELS